MRKSKKAEPKEAKGLTRFEEIERMIAKRKWDENEEEFSDRVEEGGFFVRIDDFIFDATKLFHKVGDGYYRLNNQGEPCEKRLFGEDEVEAKGMTVMDVCDRLVLRVAAHDFTFRNEKDFLTTLGIIGILKAKDKITMANAEWVSKKGYGHHQELTIDEDGNLSVVSPEHIIKSSLW